MYKRVSAALVRRERNQEATDGQQEVLLDERKMTDTPIPACWQYWGVPTSSLKLVYD
jgi:hypothetical protein